MSAGRVLSSVAAAVAVAGCAVVAVGMSRAASAPHADRRGHASGIATRTARPAYLPVGPATSTPTDSGAPSSAQRSADAGSARASSSAPPVRSTPAAGRSPVLAHATTRVAAPEPKPAPAHAALPYRGQALPLPYSTGTATRVITVVAPSSRSTTATLQAWTKAPDGGWTRAGSAAFAYVGSDGVGNASEYRSATPTGSYTLTQAFGHYSDPGTPLPYAHTNDSDWWISEPGRLYNTHQRCSSGCSFRRDKDTPNEHLYYETPYYNYAVVIDYNTANAPGGVQRDKGSAFFLHVAHGAPTAGCVAISQTKLISIMRWLTPAAHPRILIGVT